MAQKTKKHKQATKKKKAKDVGPGALDRTPGSARCAPITAHDEHETNNTNETLAVCPVSLGGDVRAMADIGGEPTGTG